MNRVQEQEPLSNCVNRIPFLSQFAAYNAYGDVIGFSMARVNEYMGYPHIGEFADLTDEKVNDMLEEAERRGDIR